MRMVAMETKIKHFTY